MSRCVVSHENKNAPKQQYLRGRPDPVADLRHWLETSGSSDGGKNPLVSLTSLEFASAPLTPAQTLAVRDLLWSFHKNRTVLESFPALKRKSLKVGNLEMPFWYTAYGTKPPEGRSLWISLHGGGGCPPGVNTSQWRNQTRLYQPTEGVYLCPRAPTNNWNLWHERHIDSLLDTLIGYMVVAEDVDPDRVYLMGYSAGADGVYHLASRMADRWAAACAMAGHPNNATPDSLRNTTFGVFMGGRDGAYNRNKVAREWKTKLANLQEVDRGGYDHTVEIYEDKGHWMHGEDKVALPWMQEKTRRSRPEKIVWRQGNTTHTRFYWLAIDDTDGKDMRRQGSRLMATRSHQEIRIVTNHDDSDGKDNNTDDFASARLRIRLDESMVDLDRPVTIFRNNTRVFTGIAPRTIGTLARTLSERGDPKGIYCSEIVVEAGE